ncbi:ECF transporter S component [Clostridium pasteurianum]|uniref:Uncharacterized protein n=1 Tax=Clostridium pasteurianum BC1 TaxID=86416 RepID=R4K7U0_CLOPA|nr:ECF transporter S component [Clostridium pasteurianum]AGK95710.1 hypothetical protein Clopa_0668 [Clostridium pasteurianum BC1]
MKQSLFPDSWVGTTPIHFPFAVNVVAYIIIWAVCLSGLYLIWKRPKQLGFLQRWSTQDVLMVAIMAVMLEVYDNMIGDQFITPIVQLIPFGHAFALNDIPYMFLLMVGVAIIRKPGAATAMVFLNFLLMQLLYGGSEASALFWPYGILQGLFVDLYIVFRKGRIFQSGSNPFKDGLIMGALRAVPAVIIQNVFLVPFLIGTATTFGYVFLMSLFNLIGNGFEAAILSALAIRVANSVNPSSGVDPKIKLTEKKGSAL